MQTICGPQEEAWFSTLFDRVASNDEQAKTEVCEFIDRALRYFVARHATRDTIEDVLQETKRIVLESIALRKIRHIEALKSYARVIALRECAHVIREQITQRTRHVELEDSALPETGDEASPEARCVSSQQVEMMCEALKEMEARGRNWSRNVDILRRFYLKGESPNEICKALKLSDTQFRLNKSRAKIALAAAVKKKLEHTAKPDNLGALSVRLRTAH